VYVLGWLFRRTYAVLDDDAQLYAFQALASLKPWLREYDLFLAYGSQDQFTVFSPLYAWLIQQVGLASAEALLYVLFHAWTLIAAWYLVRRVGTHSISWLSVGAAIMVPGYYGARWVFEYGEPFLTARLPAEALILTSIALSLGSRITMAWITAMIALVVHPIIAAPGIAVLTLISVPPRIAQWLLAAGAGVVVSIAIAAKADWIPNFLLMDADWLSVVQTRSSFMFIEAWQARDWDWALLTLVTLTFSWKATNSAPLRSLVSSAGFVGLTGFMLTALCSVAPLTLLLQGQPWRWMWLATYIAVLTSPLTIANCWNQGAISRWSCVLLYASWVFPMSWALPGIIAAPIAMVATALFWFQRRVPKEYIKYCELLGISVCIAAGATALIATSLLLQLSFTTNREHVVIERARDVLALGAPGILLVAVSWAVTIRRRRAIPTMVLAASVVAALSRVVPETHSRWTSSPYVHAYDAFADWRATLDHRRSIYWHGNAVGAWILLESPSYLTISQTAGVVFSRATSREVVRRAANLIPLTGEARYAISRHETRPGRLTLAVLAQICSDPILGYVVSSDELSIDHRDAPPGRWAGSNLYSCDTVREAES
jgi:hypothetical protein